MTKKVYLVDTENVNSTWKELLPEITKNDRLILFYTQNSPHISYADLGFILQYPDRFEMLECYTGNNGLDFQLVSYLGYLLKTAAKTAYIIVSNDTGYDSVIRFWTDRERSVSRMTSTQLMKLKHTARPAAGSPAAPKPPEEASAASSCPPAVPVPPAGEPQTSGALLQKALGKSCPPEHRDWILEMLEGFNPQQLGQIHSELQRKFGQDQGVVYYKRLRTVLRKYYALKSAEQTDGDEED